MRFFGHRFRHVGFWYPFWVWISRVIRFGSAEGFHFSWIRTLNNPAWDAMRGSHGLEWFECHRATICSMSTVHVRMRMRQNAFWEMPLDMKAMLACMPRVCDVWWTGEGKRMVFTNVNLHFIVATVSILIHTRVQVVHVVSKMNLRRLSKSGFIYPCLGIPLTAFIYHLEWDFSETVLGMSVFDFHSGSD